MAQDFRDIYAVFKGDESNQAPDSYLNNKLHRVFHEPTSLRLILSYLKITRGENNGQKSPAQDIDFFTDYLEIRANTSSTSFCFPRFKQVESHLFQEEALEFELQDFGDRMVIFADLGRVNQNDAT